MAGSYNEIAKAWGPILIGVLAILATFGAQLLLIRHQRKQFEQQASTAQGQFNRQTENARLQFESQNALARQQYELSKSQEEHQEILKKLNSFYGPFRELRTESVILYRPFAVGLQQQFREKGQGFRTLRYLLEGGRFGPQDQELLNQVLAINDRILPLIESQYGVVDNPELHTLLGKLGAHIRILKLANEGKLTGFSKLFEDIVFPLAIDGAIESATLRLQDKLNELSASDRKPPDLSADADSSIRYYDQHAEEYARQTQFTDMSNVYVPFRELVPQGARILDAGCGVGRDTRFFIEHGYTVISLDASKEMVAKCREYPHAYCLRLSFNQVAFQEAFDAVWVCASLVHTRFEHANQALDKLTTALKPGGVIFVSLRQSVNGKENEDVRGRFYEYYNEAKIAQLLASEPRLEIVQQWASPSNLKDDLGQWINVLARRKAAAGAISN
jgi:SAM-dependent methyltransferase